jgi:hypothetical protein
MDLPLVSTNLLAVFFSIFLGVSAIWFLIRRFWGTLSSFLGSVKNVIVSLYVSKKDFLLSALLMISVAFSVIASGGSKLLDLDATKAAGLISSMPTDFLRARMREFLAESNFNSSFWIVSLLPGLAGVLNYMAFSYYRRKVSGLSGALKRKSAEVDAVPRVDVDYLFEIELKQWFLALGLDGVVRATVFRDEGVKGKFSCFARYCEDDDYKEKRDYLYDKVGLIAIACKPRVNATHLKLPDPKESNDAYCKYHTQYMGMSLEKARGLRMRSRCYIAMPIKDTRKTKNIGVLVLEALGEEGLSAAICTKLEKYGYLTKLSFLMEFAEGLRPKISMLKGHEI